jgi:predicted dehydrogenase
VSEERPTARIAVIGSGWWSTHAHLPALAANPRAELVAVVDPEPSRRATAASAFNVPHSFPSMDELLGSVELDGVVIASPHGTHHELADAALRHGLHVLIEKPMVLDPGDGARLIAQAQRAGRQIIVGYPMLYSRQARAVRDAIAGGEIGPVEYVTSTFASVVREFYRRNPDAYRDAFGYELTSPQPETYARPDEGGQVYTQMTHSLSLLLWLTGLTPHTVSAFTANFELDVDLVGAAVIRFENGALASVGSTGGVLKQHEEILTLDVYGQDGHVLFDVNRGHAVIHAETARSLDRPTPAERYPESAPADNLVGVICGTEPNHSPAELGLATAVLLTAIHQSAREGGTPVTCDLNAGPAVELVTDQKGAR